MLELVAFTDRLLLDHVREAQRVGEIDPTRDAEEVATLLSVFLRGLSPTARLGASCAALEARVRAMISLVAPS